MARTEKTACRAAVPSIRKKAPDSRRRSLRRRGRRSIDRDVVAGKTRGPWREQKKRRAGQRCHPSGKRLQTRVDDHYAVEEGEILWKLRAARADFHVHRSILRTAVIVSSSRNTLNPWSRNRDSEPW